MIGEDDDELIAAEPANDTLSVRHQFELVGDVLENTVADEVAVSIIERLEVIYVHEKHGEGALASGLSTDQPL